MVGSEGSDEGKSAVARVEGSDASRDFLEQLLSAAHGKDWFQGREIA